MNKTKASKKLSLNAETVRPLDNSALDQVAGAAGAIASLFTFNCKTCTEGCRSFDTRQCN